MDRMPRVTYTLLSRASSRTPASDRPEASRSSRSKASVSITPCSRQYLESAYESPLMTRSIDAS